ncbi:unnamed protein product [Peronospora farinosa]|uniref:GYF domain-containing protein n=1 Tax=Peronospora farinosa TaxID=134698 RepID=A0AAV0SYT2_9STRA|nr:unnamed protein product [Peronospora farinosa]CAI5711107.1 unnamed protein product [Peronospora farinosa]
MAGLERRGMTAFDMEEEKDEGHFDANGNFVWDDEAKKQEEAWLEDVSEQQMGAAKHAKSRREFRDEQTEETLTTETANKTLATLVRPRETVLQALKRLGSKKTRVRPGNKRKQTHSKEAETTAQTEEEKKQFEQITEAADFLMRLGEVEVYGQTKEEFIPEEELLAQRRRVQFAGQSEGKSEEKPLKKEIMWEYKATDGKIHGPFPTSSFVAWQQQGYFTGETTVDMRQVLRISDDAAVEPAHKKQKQKNEKVSADQEMLDDFEDSDNEDDAKLADDKEKADENLWKRSDAIDFSSY